MKVECNRLFDLVLPGDFAFANELHNCMVTCIHNMFNAGSLDEANHWEKELNRCAKEFKSLRNEKEDHDVSKSYRVVVKSLQGQEINASVVSRRK
ncbi:hypothetical protein [Bacillus toyonensis]|uniref:Uncharacterized protein n=1 Tax=Bacillus toyonensis TaxID=155322 RepID=A0AB36SW21_9BACI|nr:hypothetical protein [Bacillus toyonensis]PEJ82977.1 hypothetical protein CN891_28740 [Bacillus toyonensis]PEK10463.1 hypothetical protein CN683_26275 [Bacillus toyonensis]PEL37829.1 hypothetical protein CN623_01660 [Bacillus toyonensis]PEL48616.1 hypothetical protein CN605_03945 [Bacillus toyonensis]PEN58689.1 hypothetical protein CN596_01910 [Bacillus toyonensis]